MNEKMITQYLERIGLTRGDAARADTETLCRIQYAHVTAVPYENLDLLRNVPLDLSEEALFDKIVTRRRGGYCFEINALLESLLRGLGYTTESRLARYLRGEDMVNAVPMRRHRIMLVRSPLLDGTYLADAGIGDRAMRWPLRLETNVEQKQFGEVYRFTSDPYYGTVLSDFHKGEWVPFFSFTDEKQAEDDYIQPSFWCEKHPASKFNKTNILSLKTATGRITVSDMTFRIFDGDTVTERELKPDELPAVLKDVYGIVL